ncbi:MAG: adenylate/guanylate cyclase domain-containing protein [Microthrixaceae bacterium]
MTPNLGSVLDEISEFLTGERTLGGRRVLTTVVFTDIAGSTEKAVELGDPQMAPCWTSTTLIRDQLRRFNGVEVKTTSDGFLASFDGPARAIPGVARPSSRCSTPRRRGRAGIHTGECERRGTDLGGLAVHIASRVGSIAGPSEVLVSSTVRDLVMGSDIEFETRPLKGVPASGSSSRSCRGARCTEAARSAAHP